MNAKLKIGFHILVTLVIGIVIGALINRALVHRWIREALVMRGAGLRVPGAERMLRPVSPEQEKKIQSVLDKHAKRMAEIHERFGKELEAAFKSLKEEIDPVLTPEQKALFERAIPGPPPPGFGGPRGFGGLPPLGPPSGGGPFGEEFKLAMLKNELNLSEDQAAKVKVILDDFEKKMRDARAAATPPDFDSIGRLARERDAEIDKVLTPEQREKFRRFGRREPRGPGESPPPR